MTWQKYRRYNRRSSWNGGWENLGPFIAMVANAAEGGGSDERGGRERRAEGDWDSEMGGKRRRRRGRMFGQGELRLALLALINEDPQHGYELIKSIEEMTGGGYAPSPGAVYPTLQLLEDEGKIKPAKVKGKSGGKDKGKDTEANSKKPFKVTKSGAAELEERADEVEALMGRINEHGERAEKVKERSPDLFRAMGNLASVLKNRARSGKLDKTTVDEIVDIIDEVAKRIERL